MSLRLRYEGRGRNCSPGKLKVKEPDAEEPQLLLRALQDVNLPKFLASTFICGTLDLFPGI